MVVPAHVRVSLSGVFGTIAAPVEIWNFGINLTQRPFANEAERVAYASSIKDAYNAHLRGHLRTNTILTRVRVANVEAGGLVGRGADGSYNQGDWEGAILGDGNVIPVPLQTALCVSLTTARPGARGKGRFFLPPVKYELGNDFLYPQAAMALVDEGVRAFLNAVNVLDLTPGNGDVAVVSSFGVTSTVTGVRIGRAPDTMRSRRNALKEAYIVSPLF